MDGLEKYLLMRHELALVLVLLIILIADLVVKHEKKGIMRPFSIILFLLVTVIGFLPTGQGELFGGMYVVSNLSALMKNILNIGVLIVFIQSYNWLGEEENKIKISEF
ncbi:MAG: NADH-quinone oxidoreductase subunit N, partial [Bacteroidota bacterium]